jgi:hypothetical protein
VNSELYSPAQFGTLLKEFNAQPNIVAQREAWERGQREALTGASSGPLGIAAGRSESPAAPYPPALPERPWWKFW